MNKANRVLIADDHPLVIEGVKASLQQSSEYTVVGECRRPDQTLDLVSQLSPELLILDIWMGNECSLDWLHRFSEAAPSMRILFLSALKTGDRLRNLTHSAVAGFILKDEAGDLLLQAVRIVSSGGTWFSSKISAELRRLADLQQNIYQLTPREQEVLSLIKSGRTNAEIALQLDLSRHTVRRYVTIVYQKLGVTSRTQAVLHSREVRTCVQF